LANVVGDSPSMPQRSVTQTPSNTLPSPDTSIDKAAQVQGSQEVPDSAPNGAAVFSSSGAVAPSQSSAIPISTGAKAAVASVPSSNVSFPKERLPQDRVGILEDRIAEDPRGDIDAWLSLISEHTQRNKLDEARAVYDRFFVVFPTAVRLNLPFHRCDFANSRRLNNG
jgi:cleavage stimulation factor subunit 3